ncbi:ankyrin repeat domain-containing protein 53 [Anolis carolinensis]|uniref:ankyrin repeat domain-containing protein 53 n=1 Tax=Anolis carolinensis TaxID=28377 RepID=UPI002F2B1812
MGSPKGGRRSRQRGKLGRLSRVGTASAISASGIGRSPSKPRRQSSAKVRPKEVHYAASVGNVHWLQMCLQKAENPTQADINGFSALHTSALRGRLDCIQVMVEKYSVDVNLPSATGWCPIHLVLSKENGPRALECLTFLLSKGADVNVRNWNGMSPLHRAASEGHDKCIQALIRTGADVNAKDADGQRPIDLARMWGQRACAKSLENAMWKVEKDKVAKEMCKLDRIKADCEARRMQFLQTEQTEVDVSNAVAFDSWLAKKRLRPPSNRILSYLERKRPSASLRKLSKGTVSPMPSVALPVPKEEAPSQERGLQPWNPSTSLSSRPATRISRPTIVRLGVEPEEAAAPDFSSFLFLVRNAFGGPKIHMGRAGTVPYVPDLPFEELKRGLLPQRWAPRPRLHLPRDLRPMDIQVQKHKRPPEPRHRWTDQLALSLRQTLDPGSARTLRAHHGLFATGGPSPPRRGSGQGKGAATSSSSSSSSHSASLLSKTSICQE